MAIQRKEWGATHVTSVPLAWPEPVRRAQGASRRAGCSPAAGDHRAAAAATALHHQTGYAMNTQ